MANFLYNGPCEHCHSRDNLAHYDDGSSWCWGCHHYTRANNSSNLWTPKEENDNDIQLANDLVFDYPGHVVAWLGRYRVSVPQAIGYGWKYSPSRDQLVFLFADAQGNTACVQSRNFREGSQQKYYNQGSPADVLPIFLSSRLGTGTKTKSLVVVEDAVSAARVAGSARPLEGPWCDAMPCLGSYLPLKKLTALKGLNYTDLNVWLDSDKLKEARDIAQRAKWLGFHTRVIYTELDPKEYSDSEIQEILK